MKKHLLLIYEVEQLPAIRRLIRNSDDAKHYVVLALRADIESELEAAEIPYESAAIYRETDATERMRQVEDILQQLEANSTLRCLRHRDIPLMKVQSIVIQDYLTNLLYWMEILVGIIKAKSPVSISVFSSIHTVHEKPILSHRVIDVVVRAARLVTAHNNIPLDVKSQPGPKFFWYRVLWFKTKRSFFSLGLLLVNQLTKLFRSARSMRLLIADVWRNVEPYAAALPQAELVMLDRIEFFNLGWSSIKRHRTQFIAHTSFSRWSHRQLAHTKANNVRRWWHEHNSDVKEFSGFTWQGIDLETELMTLFRTYANHSVAADVHEIEQIYAMLITLRPNAVMVRASASKQKHLMLLCLIAKELGISSIEPQHGWYYLGPGGTHRRSVATNIATYGPFCSTDFKNNGYIGHCEDVGSPRFDIYQQLPDTSYASDGPLKVLIGLMDDMTGRWTDTYDIKELIETIKAVLDKTTDIEIRLKAKPHSEGNDYGFDLAMKELQSYPNFKLLTDQSMVEAIQEADVTMSIFSTIILESMLVGRPVLYWARPPFHKMVFKSGLLATFESDAGLKAVYSSADLISALEALRNPHARQTNGIRAKKFMSTQFGFQAGSSQRLARLVRRLADRPN